MIPRCSINNRNDRKLTFFVDDSSRKIGWACRCWVSQGKQTGLTGPKLLRKQEKTKVSNHVTNILNKNNNFFHYHIGYGHWCSSNPENFELFSFMSWNQKHDIPYLFPYTIPFLTRDWNTRPYFILMKMEGLHLQLHWVLMIAQKFLTLVPCMQLLQSSVDRWSIASVISCKVFHVLRPPPTSFCHLFSIFCIYETKSSDSKEEKWTAFKTRKKTCGCVCLCPHTHKKVVGV